MPRYSRRSNASTGVSSSFGELDALLTAAPTAATQSSPKFPLLPQFWGEEVRYVHENDRDKYRLQIRSGRLVDWDGRLLAPVRPIDFMFVQTTAGDILVCDPDSAPDLRHSSLVCGGCVAAAGQLTAHSGQLLALSNESGHYMPPPSTLQSVVTALAELGLIGVDEVQLNVIRSEAYDAPACRSDGATRESRQIHTLASPPPRRHFSPPRAAQPLPRREEPRVLPLYLPLAGRSEEDAPRLAPLVQRRVVVRAFALKCCQRALFLLVPAWLYFSIYGGMPAVLGTCVVVIEPTPRHRDQCNTAVGAYPTSTHCFHC